MNLKWIILEHGIALSQMCLFEHWIGLCIASHSHSQTLTHHIIFFLFLYSPFFVPTSTWHISCMVIFWFFDTFAALLPDLIQNIINLWMLEVYWNFTLFFSFSLFFVKLFNESFVVLRFFSVINQILFIFIFGSNSIFSVCIWHFLTIIRLFRS